MIKVVLNEDYTFVKKTFGRKLCKRPIVCPLSKIWHSTPESLDKVAKELQKMWKMPTYRFYLNFTNTSENEFKVDWLPKETKKEISFADENLNKIKQEVSSFLKDTEIKKN